MPDQEPLLTLQGIKVTRGGNQILDFPQDKTVRIFSGDRVGIIGENGAGTSTLINCIIGEMPFKGKIERHFTLDDLGVQFQYNAYDARLKVGELVEIISDSKLSSADLKSEMKGFELGPLLKKKISKLSGGERQRMTLFLVLQKNPKLLILDELTTGLDYQKRQEILHTLKQKTTQKTVLSVTHYFEELAGWMGKLLILHKGHLVFWGAIDTLRERYKWCYSIIEFPKDALDRLDVKSFRQVEVNNDTFGIFPESQEQAESFLKVCASKNIPAQNRLMDIYVMYTLALGDYERNHEVLFSE